VALTVFSRPQAQKSLPQAQQIVAEAWSRVLGGAVPVAPDEAVARREDVAASSRRLRPLINTWLDLDVPTEDRESNTQESWLEHERNRISRVLFVGPDEA
jgi:hypothetical protein